MGESMIEKNELVLSYWESICNFLTKNEINK